MSIVVTGSLSLDPANADAAAEAFRTLMTATRAEAGCEAYAFAADLDAPGTYWIQEQWLDQASMDAHMASDHMAAFFGAMGGLGVTSASLTKWVGATAEKLM